MQKKKLLQRICNNKIKKEVHDILLTMCAALVSIVSIHTFVVPAEFSPSGIEGICTILYELTGINLGWFKLLINIPLIILAWIFLNKKYVFYVIFFTLMDSLGIILLENINFYVFIPQGIEVSQAVGYRLLAAIFSGVMFGVCVGLMLKIGYSTGGVDIIACLVHRSKSHFNIERIISVFGYTIVALSYFVYWDLTSILLSIIQIFIGEWTITGILRKERYALEVKIITKEPEKIRDEILYTHKHSATIVESKGLYTNERNYTVISVMNSRDIPEFMNTMKKHPDTFVYITDGVRVQGEFHFNEYSIGGRVDAYQ